ncbi:hypothetical protein [Candidatus Nitronereus thalassa]|uniref:Bacteriophage Mu GpT domain-containing protein n=1 Tax=Candidatus Nitronereus thalassa TaxID=3020898 RepID=A0ABU3K397_9BACT|nr:hypothetical protein [Candidatus Nitronereus thalassa]MDT7040870.1 hypothetical protein [Candidatus Nitronereus thalassa]
MATRLKTKTQQAEIPDTLSLDRLRESLREAIKATLLVPDGEFPNFFIESIFANRVIIRDDNGQLWQYAYTVAADSAITLGDRTAVEVDFKPVQQAWTGQGDVRITQALNAEGTEWEVHVLRAGLGANRQFFPEATLRQCAGVFEGARVFCLDDGQHSKTGDKSAKQIVGWIHQSAFTEGVGITGRLQILQTADWLRQNLLDSHAKGKPDLYGLSVDAPGHATTRQIQQSGQPMAVQYFTKITAPATVDVVWNPGTPGGFQRALNAQGAQPEEELLMLDKLLKILQAKRPEVYATLDQNNITEDRVLQLIEHGMDPAQAQQATDAPAPTGPGHAPGKTAPESSASPLSDEDRALIRQATITGWNGQVREALAESKLPEVMQAQVRKRFMDHPGDLAQVQQAITEHKETLDALSPAGKVTGMGHVHQVTVESEIEQIQQAMDKMMGIRDVPGDVPAFRGLKHAYRVITGDQEMQGDRSAYDATKLSRMLQAATLYTREGVDQEKPGYVRAQQAQLASSWPLILGNTLYRRLIQEYAAVEYGENFLISNRRRATDFRTIEANNLGYFADLPTVDTEQADYTEAAELGEEGVGYTVGTRGVLVTVTRKTMLNDDLGAVTQIPTRLGRAARRTLARFLWNFWIANSTYDGDATAWFHANHSNLGSTALTANAAGVAAVVAALDRLAAQTEPGSAERLAGAWWLMQPVLVVPGALAGIAKQLNQSGGIPGAANNGDNSVAGLFGDAMKPERIFVNPLLTDATDWGLLRNPSEIGILEVAFLNGQEQPELFLADSPTVGQMFLADKLQYKIRHEYGAEIVDFRGADKSVVAG